MRVSDIVTRLALLLPQETDLFTTNSDALSVTRVGSVVTVQCAKEHGLETGNAVVISGAVTQIPIDVLSRVGPLGTLVTSRDHDLTTDIAPTVTISDAGGGNPIFGQFNGTFDVIQIVNRRTITFVATDSGSSGPTTGVLEEAESALRQYDGIYQVDEVLSPSSFTITNSATTMDDPLGSIEVRGKPRISAAVTIERAISSYTEQEEDEYWAFVVLEDVNASKSRNVRSDAIDNLQPGNHFRQQVIQPFSVFVFVPAQDDIGEAEARDQNEDLFAPLCRSILAAKFDSRLFVGKQGPVQFVGHGAFAENTAVYVHRFSFQQTVDLYEQDTVGPDLDVAFRNLDFTINPSLEGAGEGALTASIDLDDDPL